MKPEKMSFAEELEELGLDPTDPFFSGFFIPEVVGREAEHE